MPVHIHILNSCCDFRGHEAEIRTSIKGIAKELSNILKITDLDIVVAHDPSQANHKIGIGGMAFNPKRLDIYFNMKNSNISGNIKQYLRPILGHELHHCARMELVGMAKTLIDNLVMEGLACQFEDVITGKNDSLLFKNIRKINWQKLYKTAIPHLNDIDFEFKYWFHGASPKLLPKYAGYWVGYNLVLQYMAKNDKDWIDLMNINASKFE